MKLGIAGKEQQEMVMKYMIDRFHNSVDEKNYTLIRSNII